MKIAMAGARASNASCAAMTRSATSLGVVRPSR